MYPIITIVFLHFPWAPGRMSFLLKCASANLKGFFFQQSQVCVGFIPESKLKSEISHSSIHLGFIELVTWLGVRGLWKKGLKRLKECLRVTLSKNLKSIARTLFISTFELDSALFVLYIDPLLYFCAFLVKPGDLCLSFPSLAFGGFFFFLFFFLFIVAQLHACVVCIALPASLAVVPT